jgi:type IV pilus assembly protein PilW
MRRAQTGMSILELMVAITIGLLLLTGLAALFANSSHSQREVARAAQQIENGRYAMDVLMQDLQLAGFLGDYRKLVPPASADPCSFAINDLSSAVGLPVQGYHAASLTTRATPPGTCSSWLPEANLQPGSDILVVRRADTEVVPIGTVTATGSLYLQSNASTIAVQGGGGTTSCESTADGTTTSAITRRCVFPGASDICSALCPGGSPVGYIRRLRVHVYFIAPCSLPASGTLCGNAADDGGRPIPTLKRLELTHSGATPTFEIVPIAEGVEFMKIGYGIDDMPSTVNPDTGLIGDGAPDRYVLSPTIAEYGNAVTARIDLLVRNPEPSLGFTETKTFHLGVSPAAPTSAAHVIGPADVAPDYRRHVYSAEVRLVNQSARKENP